MPNVIVMGGGVAGLTAAHELAERGFEVHVHEARTTWGGKARSQPAAPSPCPSPGGERELWLLLLGGLVRFRGGFGGQR